MLLNKSYPAYDVSLEVLCMLSSRPLGMSDIAADLGYSSQRALRSHVGKLRAQGHDVITERHTDATGHGNVIRLGKTWRDGSSLAAALNYWRLVYESPANRVSEIAAGAAADN